MICKQKQTFCFKCVKICCAAMNNNRKSYFESGTHGVNEVIEAVFDWFEQ